MRVAQPRQAQSLHRPSGLTLVEILVSLALILLVAAAGYLVFLQSWASLAASRDIRHAISDLQAVLERVHALPMADLFADLPHEKAVPSSLIGGFILPTETITVAYEPGTVSNVVREGSPPNKVRFVYGGSVSGDYKVDDVKLKIKSGSSTVTYSPSFANLGTVNTGTERTADFGLGSLALATKVWLEVELEDVTGKDEVDIFINDKGPYTPGPEFYGGGSYTGDVFLPDLNPLRATARATWSTYGHEMLRSLTTARN